MDPSIVIDINMVSMVMDFLFRIEKELERSI